MKNGKAVFYTAVSLVNAIVLYVGSILFPAQIVLGNYTLPPILAALATGVLLTGVMALTESIIKYFKLKIKKEMHFAMVYLAGNILGLWVLARLANYTGFGVSSYVVVIILGLLLNTLQYGVWKMFMGKKK